MNFNSKQRKGQAATEFLMTYGWAILAIVIVAAVLWNMGVFKGQCAKTAPVQVFGSGEQIQASDWTLDTNNNLTISLKNLAGNDINISVANVTVNGASGTNDTGIPSLSSGGDLVLFIPGPTGSSGVAGNCFTADVRVDYSVKGGVQEHTARGTVRGKY